MFALTALLLLNFVSDTSTLNVKNSPMVAKYLYRVHFQDVTHHSLVGQSHRLHQALMMQTLCLPYITYMYDGFHKRI